MGQGATTNGYANKLRADDWTVVYKCVPNTPHTGVVPIPIAGPCKQHYPDLLAFKGDKTRIVEVEVQLSEDVADKIIERFAEMLEALSNRAAWNTFRTHVAETTKHILPLEFRPECELIICKVATKPNPIIERLRNANIALTFYCAP